MVGLQTKLRVNEPGDAYEQEADRAAEQVLAQRAHPGVSSAPPRIQRYVEQPTGQADAAPASVERVLASPGRSLEPALRQDMEQRFGHDFSRVRVHSDSVSEQSTREVNAHAYTIGHNIAFGSGKFAPASNAGRKLLAHELAHVVQQTQGVVPFVQRRERKTQVWTTITEISVEAGAVGEGRGTAVTSDGQTLSIDIEVNNLGVGHYSMDKLQQQPDREAWSRIHYKSLSANLFVYLIPPGSTVAANAAIVIEPKIEVQEAARTRQTASGESFLEPKALLDKFEAAIDQKLFQAFAHELARVALHHPRAPDYLDQIFEELDSDDEDEAGAEFINVLSERNLDTLASSHHGRATLSVIYAAIITGKVTEFQREQANRVLLAKARQYTPEQYAQLSKTRGGGRPTRIFPVRFMRISGGQDAPIEARLTKDGKVHVSYPVRVKRHSMFQQEWDTQGNIFGYGEDINPNEIVGIKDYEAEGEAGKRVVYLPALALIDYSNRAIQSTSGKIIEVSVIAATMGLGGGAAAGSRAAAEHLTATARWGSHIAKGARMLDRISDFVGIASLVITEHREWIIKRFGGPGKRLVQAADVANSIAGIYGMARLGQAGYGIVRDMQRASRDARRLGGSLSEAEDQVLKRVDDETDAMLRELDEQAGKQTSADVGGGGSTRPAGAADEIHASAVRANISPKKLEEEVADLRRQAINPDNVTVPSREGFDAEMATGAPGDKHRFERNTEQRTWCRSSEEACELNLGNDLNAKVDDALSEKKSRASGKQEPPAPTTQSEAAAGTAATTAKIDPEATAKISARDRAREATQKKIAQIERRQKSARKKIDDLKVKIDKTSTKIKQLEEKVKNSSGAEKARAEGDLERARYRLEEEKGGGLKAEREGLIEELTELARKKANLIQALKLERPSLREATKRAIESKAPREATPPYRFLDRKGRPIAGPINYGHIYGKEHRRLALEAQERGMNQAQFNDWVNSHPEWFQIESQAENLSHGFEKPGID
jgi:hypothetical protein